MSQTGNSNCRSSIDENENGSWVPKTKYYIRSSVLGDEVVSELDDIGRKIKTYVIANNTIVATQNVHYEETTSAETLLFNHQDISGTSYRSSLTNGTVLADEGGQGSPAEFDPTGGNAGLRSPFDFPSVQNPSEFPGQQTIYTGGENRIDMSQSSFVIDGFEVPNWVAESAVREGATAHPGNNGRLALAQAGFWSETPGDNSGSGDTCVNGVCPDGPVQVNWNPSALTWNGANTIAETPAVLSKPTWEQIIQAASDCLNDLWPQSSRKLSLEINERASSGVKNGIITINNSTDVPSGAAGQPFSTQTRYNTVITDATSSTGTEISNRYHEDNKKAPTRGNYLPGYTPYKSGNTGTNLLANDLVSHPNANTFTGLGNLIGRDLALQLHEAGNNASVWYGELDASAKYGELDRDAGMRFEECIYNKLK